MIKKILLVVGLLACWAAHAQLNITVTGGQTAPQPIAVVPFQNGPGVTFDVAQIVQDDLASSGLFKALPRSDMLEKPSTPEQVNYRNWQVLGVNDIVIGQETASGDGVAVRFYLLDTFGQKQLLGYDMPVVPVGQLRYVAHRIADLVYQKLTGIPGYFDTQIAYVEASGLGMHRNFKLVVADWDGKFPHVIASSNEPILSVAWSPDRKRLAFVGYHNNRSAVYVDTLATGTLREVTSVAGVNGSPAWSPDGRSLAVTLTTSGANTNIYIVDVATGQRRQLTHDSGINAEPAWSPDGQTIAFVSDRGGNPQIYTMPAGGGAATRVTFEGVQNQRPAYSPNGKLLAMADVQGGLQRIAIMPATGGPLKILTSGPVDESPSFAPNSNVLIYEKRTASGTELATVSIDGHVNQILRGSTNVQEPAWSP
ncbi:MAG TPA: Tol-Pal system beta propeller repeat protein TolB, partial [Nevskiaceae bacterium]